MKVITTNQKAGGVGKSQSGLQIAYTAASLGKRVLVIGQDTSRNITRQLLGYYGRLTNQNKDDLLELIAPENTVEAIYKKEVCEPIKITDNIDLIAETTTLYKLTNEKFTSEASLLHWYWDNQESLEQNYDYIIIDTHNDDSIFTRAAYVVSDLIILLVDQSYKTYEMVTEMRELLEVVKSNNRSQEGSLVQAEIKILGNKLGNDSEGKKMRQLLTKLHNQNPDEYLGYIELRSEFSKSESQFIPLVELQNTRSKDASLERFYRNTFKIYREILGL